MPATATLIFLKSRIFLIIFIRFIIILPGQLLGHIEKQLEQRGQLEQLCHQTDESVFGKRRKITWTKGNNLNNVGRQMNQSCRGVEEATRRHTILPLGWICVLSRKMVALWKRDTFHVDRKAVVSSAVERASELSSV